MSKGRQEQTKQEKETLYAPRILARSQRFKHHGLSYDYLCAIFGDEAITLEEAERRINAYIKSFEKKMEG